MRKELSGLTLCLPMGRSDRKKPRQRQEKSFPALGSAVPAYRLRLQDYSFQAPARGVAELKPAEKLSFPASLAARPHEPRAKPACACAVAGRADGGGEAVASSVLVRSLKRVRAVGRWRSLVRSLVSRAAAAAGSGGNGGEPGRQLPGSCCSPPPEASVEAKCSAGRPAAADGLFC